MWISFIFGPSLYFIVWLNFVTTNNVHFVQKLKKEISCRLMLEHKQLE